MKYKALNRSERTKRKTGYTNGDLRLKQTQPDG